MQVVLHHFPGAQVEYRFRCRTEGRRPAPLHRRRSAQEVADLCRLRFREEELAYLRGLRFMKSDFVDFLGLFQFNEKYIAIGPRRRAGRHGHHHPRPVAAHHPLRDPGAGDRLGGVLPPHAAAARPRRGPPPPAGRRSSWCAPWSPSSSSRSPTSARAGASRAPGTRRCCGTLKREVPQYFAGTSNVWFAMRNDLTPLGTMAHEYMQACQALGPRLRDSQIFAFDMWAQEYRGDLGIALSDTYGMDAFLRDFDMYFCKLFDGARHDSGDPFEWGERMIAHYQRNRVDPRTKTLIFSDQLSVPARHRDRAALPRPRAHLVRHRHQPHQRPRLRADQHRHQDDRVQRPAGRQGVRRAGQDGEQGRGLPRYLRQVFGLEPAEKT